MNHAYILVQASPGTSFEVLSTVREIKGVKQAHAIMGPTDGIVFVETADLEELAEPKAQSRGRLIDVPQKVSFAKTVNDKQRECLCLKI